MKQLRLLSMLLLLPLAGCSTLGVGNYSAEYFAENYLYEDSKFITIDEEFIHYKVEGPEDGEAVVLLHGMLSSIHTWDDWTKELAKEYRVYRFDLPGFGFSKSTRQAEYYDPQKRIYSHGMNTLLDQLGVESAHIVGNSLGGYASWNFAVDYPARVKSLTVVDAVSYPQDMPLLLKISAAPVLNTVSRLQVPGPLISMGAKQVYGDSSKLSKFHHKRYKDMMMYKGNRESLAVTAKILKENAQDETLGDRIKDITVPTLVMWGGKDTWTPTRMAKRWKEDLPSSKVIIYPEAGHVPMEEIPEETLEDFLAFIQTVE